MTLLEITLVPLKARIPVTPNMFVVLVAGGILAMILKRMPDRFSSLSRIVGIVTILAAGGVGVVDLKGGDAFGSTFSRTSTSPDCVGWHDYVENYDQAFTGQEDVLIIWNDGDLTSSDVEGLASRVSILADDLDSATPPPAAAKIHIQMMSILGELEKQLNSYADGGDFNPRRLNRLQDGLGGLVDSANAKCV